MYRCLVLVNGCTCVCFRFKMLGTEVKFNPRASSRVRCTGALGYWCTVVLVQRCTDLLVYWFISVPVCQCAGAFAQETGEDLGLRCAHLRALARAIVNACANISAY